MSLFGLMAATISHIERTFARDFRLSVYALDGHLTGAGLPDLGTGEVGIESRLELGANYPIGTAAEVAADNRFVRPIVPVATSLSNQREIVEGRDILRRLRARRSRPSPSGKL